MPPTNIDAPLEGTVPLMLGLQMGSQQALFGPITPGHARTYVTSVAAIVTSTAPNAQLSASDASGGNGRLTNGTYQLASPLYVRATNSANTATAFAPLSATPATLLSYPREISNDAVTITLQQPIGASEALLAGGYTKTIRFVLSSTTP